MSITLALLYRRAVSAPVANSRVGTAARALTVKLAYSSDVFAVREGTRVIDSFSNRSCDRLVFEKTWEVNVATGTIKKVVAERGFGFISASDAKEYFFHRNSLDSSLDFDRLVGGEQVQFEIEESPKGPRASRVQSA